MLSLLLKKRCIWYNEQAGLLALDAEPSLVRLDVCYSGGTAPSGYSHPPDFPILPSVRGTCSIEKSIAYRTCRVNGL
jgi:hypothetical protein